VAGGGQRGLTGMAHDADGEQEPDRLLGRALSLSPLNVGLYDAHLRHVRINAAMRRALGLPSEAAGLGRRLAELYPGAGFEAFEAFARRVMTTGEAAVWNGFGLATPDTRSRAWQVTVSPVRDGPGRVCGVLAVGQDVSGHRLARDRLALVNEASERIGSTLDIGTTAGELADVAVPRLADVIVVDLLDSVLRGKEPTAGPVAGTAALRRVVCRSVLDGAPEVVFGAGEVSAHPERSASAACLAGGRSVMRTTARGRLEFADAVRTARAAQFGIHSVLVVPVRARGAVLGVASFMRHQQPERFEEDDLVLAEDIVSRAAMCIDNARQYAGEHAAALALQHSLRQRRQPAQAAVQVATRYRPAQAGAAVGGDWLDVIPLSGGRVGLVVGDVVGHGVPAAAAMGRLRTAVRTLADLDLEPGELLTRLDDVITRLDGEDEPAEGAADLSATCLYAVYDPTSRRCCLARAGHPPPAVVTPGRAARFLELAAGPPLGLGGLPFEETEIQLPEGSLLIFYTDGLIESRRRDLDAGMQALRGVLDGLHRQGKDSAPALDSVCDRLVASLVPEQAEDDTALLAVRTCALPADRAISWDLPAEPAAVAGARARAARQLADWGLDELTFPTEVLVSELVTNAIQHAQPPLQLRMILDTALSCEVADASSTAPHPRRADRYDEDGRGLMLVAQIAARWGTRYTRSGKTVWAQQPLPRRSAPPLSR
jgi:serine phosphatase RsbU (regulator of sigma subunit)